MRKIFVFFVVCFFALSGGKAQELEIYNNYLLNAFLQNPALSATQDFTSVKFNGRKQWFGFENAPVTATLNGHTGFRVGGRNSNNVLGVGGYLFSDQTDVLQRFGLQASVSYAFAVTRKARLSLGASFSASQYALDETGLEVFDSGDPLISGTVRTMYALPDIDFGAYFYTRNFYASLSLQLTKAPIRFNGELYAENPQNSSYFLHLGYKYDISREMVVEPSVLVKVTRNFPVQYDANLKFYYQNVWGGISYRTGNMFRAMFGVKFQRYYLGYGYDYSLTPIRSYHSGSHNIMLGINFGEKFPAKPGAVKCPGFLQQLGM